jgi:hypothetical protein
MPSTPTGRDEGCREIDLKAVDPRPPEIQRYTLKIEIQRYTLKIEIL